MELFIFFSHRVAMSVSGSMCVCVCAIRCIFLGLSLALRSHDQFQASHCPAPPPLPPPRTAPPPEIFCLLSPGEIRTFDQFFTQLDHYKLFLFKFFCVKSFGQY